MLNTREDNGLEEPLIIEITENENENDKICTLCLYKLKLDDVWECKTCKQKCHEFCFKKHIFYNSNKCPFCNTEINESSGNLESSDDEEDNTSVTSIHTRQNINHINGGITLLSRYFLVMMITSFIWYRFICIC